jgi:transposase
VVLHGRTLQSTPESGARATYDGYKRRKGSKLHMVVDTLGHLLTLTVRPAGQQERAQVETLVTAVQAVTSDQVAVAFADPGYTVAGPAMAAAEQGITLEIVPLPETKRGFALLPRRWVVERSFAWLSRFQRLARDFERLPEMLAGLHCLAFACLMLAKAVKLFASS